MLLAALTLALPAAAKGGAIAYDLAETRAPDTIRVGSPAFGPGADIPKRYSAYEDNISIPLLWTAGPAGTTGYAVIIEDPDAAPEAPVVHWLVWNIPVGTTDLPAGIAAEPNGPVRNLRQGQNAHGGVGYYGPHPPENDPAHRYFVQVYALDGRLALSDGATRDDLVAGLKGHVLARGMINGLFARPDNPTHP